MPTVTIDRDHYRQLLIAAGQDAAEATATAIGNGADDGPGPSLTALMADAYRVEPGAADDLADAYLEALQHLCRARGLAEPGREDMLDGIAQAFVPRRHPHVSLDALVAHLRRTATGTP